MFNKNSNGSVHFSCHRFVFNHVSSAKTGWCLNGSRTVWRPVWSQILVDVVIKPGHKWEDCDGSSCGDSEYPDRSSDKMRRWGGGKENREQMKYKGQKKVWLSYRLNVGRKKNNKNNKQKEKNKLTMLNLLAEIKFSKTWRGYSFDTKIWGNIWIFSEFTSEKWTEKSLGLNCFSKKKKNLTVIIILYIHIQTHTEKKKLYKVKFFES